MDDAAIGPARHRLNVHDYHRMSDAGIFGEHERVELIEGDLIDMAPIGSGHAGIVSALTEALVIACAGRATLWPQSSIRLDLSNEPQPDLAVLRRRSDFYTGRELPGPADVMLLIEVSASSLRFDRTVKLPLYARSGIAEFWIIDLDRRVLDAYKGPSGDGYTELMTHRPGDRLALTLAPEIIVQLDIVFG